MRPLSAEQLNWQPAPGSWCVAECIQHLVQANREYLPPIEAALRGKPEAPVAEVTPGWFGRWFIRAYIDPVTQKRKGAAPAKIRVRTVEPDILDVFLRTNEVVREAVRQAAPYDVNHIRFVNPFFPLIRFTVGTGFEIIWRHQRRHLLQAERVTKAPGFPNAT